VADTFTTNLNLDQPEVGSSVDSWGGKLNTDLAVIDALFATSGTGTVIVRDSSNRANTTGVAVSKAAGTGRSIDIFTGASQRWGLICNSDAESGSNAGSNFRLDRYSDAGAFINGSLVVTRATGQFTFETTPQVGANAMFHAGNSGSLSPGVGEVRMWLGSADPAGGFWMIEDGRAISRATYATLFSLIGTTYGAGDGTTTFNIRNMSERVAIGKAAAKTLIPQYDATVLGNAFGEGLHALSIAELPGHTHVFAGTSGAVTGTVVADDNSSVGSTGAGGGPSVGIFSTTTPAHSIPLSINNFTPAGTNSSVGSGNGHNVVQPSMVTNYIVRVL
jgi:microcystin-dependent protein